MQIRTLLLATLLPLGFALTACNGGDTNTESTDASAETADAKTATNSEDIKARQDIMKNWSDAMGAMGGMVKNPDTFDASLFKAQAQFLAEDASSPWSYFGNKEEMGGSTEAVWSNAETFKAEAENFQKVAAELNKVAQTATSLDELMPAFGPVGASCKSCHKEFKVPDDK